MSYTKKPQMYKIKSRSYPRKSYPRSKYQQERLALQSVELKYLDTAQSSVQVSTTVAVPTGGQLSLIPQGDTESSRDGRKCVVKSIHIRGTCTYTPGTDATATTSFWAWIILDKQCNGAAASVTDVFTSSSAATLMHNLSNVGRFQVLRKWRVNLQPGAGVSAAYDVVQKPFDIYKTCTIPMQFSSTTGAIAEIKSNNIFLLTGADGDASGVSFNSVARIRFVG